MNSAFSRKGITPLFLMPVLLLMWPLLACESGRDAKVLNPDDVINPGDPPVEDPTDPPIPPAADPNAPDIQSLFGEHEDGGTAIISGALFGTHNLDIEWLGGKNGKINTMPLGSRPTDWGPDWYVGVSTVAEGIPVLDTQKVRANRNQSIRGWKGGSGWAENTINSGFIYEPGSAGSKGGGYEFNEMYATWWTYFEPLRQDGNCPDWGPQWKMWRLGADLNWSHSFSNTLGEIMSSGNSNLSSGRRGVLYTDLYDGPPSHYSCETYPESCHQYGYPNGVYSWHGLPTVEDMRKWVRWEVYVKASSAPDAKDGSYIYTMTVPGEGKWIIDWEDQICTHRDVDWSGQTSTWLAWTRFSLQNYYGNCGYEAKWHHDDMYIQLGSRARVELANNIDYAAATHREIQAPSQWSDDSISITVNHGSFSPNDEVYLFVVREDGSVSAGFPVTLSDITSVR